MASKNSKVSGPKHTLMYVVWKISVLYLSAFGFERLCFPSPPAVQALCHSVSLLLCSVAPSEAVLQPGHREGHGAGLGAAEQAALLLTSAGGDRVCSSLYHAQRGMEAEPTATLNSVQH